MNNARKILMEMNIIEEECPIACEYEEDARHTWPERWKRLRDYVGKLYETEATNSKEGDL